MNLFKIREEIPKEAAEELKNYPELVRHLLYHRGVRSSDEAERFLNPSYESHLHDPYLLKDMEKAADRLARAIENKEKIVIYSDYDADGIPGAVVMSDFLDTVGHKDAEVYIPHRHDEGYGVHMEAVEEVAARGAKLIITIDCGISDAAEIKRAGELGLDVIVTDHHEPPADLPPAFAVVDPKRKDDEYPFKHLCGAAVAWKLVMAVLKKKRFGMKEGAEKWLLDMVGLATLADMVPLVGENRVLAKFGLLVMRKSPRPGLSRLLRRAGVDQRHITEDDIGFVIAPRINAASRMDAPIEAFRLLATEDEAKAEELSAHLERINDERKGLVASVAKEVRHAIRERYGEDVGRRVIVVGNPKWRPAILGLAANSVAEDFGCPVFLWGREKGDGLKGSCRSGNAVNLVKLMEAARDAFTDFGGHAYSGGFSVSHEKIHLLEEALSRAYESMGQAAEREPDFIDRVLIPEEVGWDFYSHLEKLAPFGVGNEKPKFLFKSAKLKGVRRFGKESNHLEIALDTDNGVLPAIGFFMGNSPMVERLSVSKKADIVATLEKSMFRNYPELRLRIIEAE